MEEVIIEKVKIALRKEKSSIAIGNFRGKFENGELDIYYNLDCGKSKRKMLNVTTGCDDDLSKAHYSCHFSGEGHLKLNSFSTSQKGNISDGRPLINKEEDLLILGLESFCLDGILPETNKADDSIVIGPDNLSRYSILWLFVHSSYPNTLPNRTFWVNLWGNQKELYRFQTASLSDILVSHDTLTVLKINNWTVRACFLKTTTFDENNDTSLMFLKSQQLPWRSLVFVDPHLPLSKMIREKALKKRIILTTQKPFITENSASSAAWVKVS
ncbi:MAG: hypothetical protein COT84_04405 [Chlamydiae bacterium CG10_big_fil_rev_8_21_14_0_10_35_9]|nr:MAG: hypothetical protein COT84_04405 [Chlamydiae bacterium CG10_big_fil_rev_8_21_14_0_10_35_9]